MVQAINFDQILPIQYKITRKSAAINIPTIKYPPLCVTESEAQAHKINSANPIDLSAQFFAKILAKPIPIAGANQGQSQLGFAITPRP